MQGKLIIGTEIDDSGITQGVSKLETKYENKKIELELTTKQKTNEEAKLQSLNDELSRMDKKYGEITAKIKEQEELISQITTRTATGGYKIPTENMTQYSKALSTIDVLRGRQMQMLPDMDKNIQAIQKQEAVVDRINAKYAKQRNQLAEISNEIAKTNSPLAQTNTYIKSAGKSVTKAIHNVKKWALAIFGIRSAYLFLRRSMSTLTEHNAQLKADIEYIRNALAFALEPVILAIVNLVKKLLYYIAYIIKAWTGKNIFENANKSLKSANGQAKKLQKTLAGFDEMNILNDQDGGDGGGAVAPSFDLTDLEGKQPWWVEWIGDNPSKVLGFLAGLITSMKVLGPLVEKFGYKLGIIKALGIGVMIYAIVQFIKDLLAYLKDPSWENFGKIIKDIGLFIIGLGMLLSSWPMVIAGALVIAAGYIIQHWEEVKKYMQDWVDDLRSKADEVEKDWGWVGKNIYLTFVESLQSMIDVNDAMVNGMNGTFDGLIKTVKGIFKKDWPMAWEGAKETVKSVFGAIIKIADATLGKLVRFGANIGAKVGEVISQALKFAINGVISAIEMILNAPIMAINGLIGIINKIPGVSIGTLPTFDLPRLARGGIVNNPGPGVMMGNYIAGEGGPEAVIPLNDETLDRLGLAFARHTQINANITTTMNGRLIARELKKVNNESDFAYNG